jgi:hypothetical protein
MPPDFSAPALIECVRRYYPSRISPDEPGYTQSEEHQRLQQLRREAAAETGRWQRFVQQVEEAFPHCDVINDPSLVDYPSYRCQVFWRQAAPSPLDRTCWDVVVCALSAMAPVYAIHASHHRDDGTERESWMRYPPLPPGFQPCADTLAGLIEATLGATRLPNEVLFTRVPGIRPNRWPPDREPWLAELLFG